jgi:hypothetical protein
MAQPEINIEVNFPNGSVADARPAMIGAGYHQLGDLCWASDHELRKLFYVGRKTARHIRTVIWQLRARPLEPAHAGNGR